MKLRRGSLPQADVPTASMPDVAFLLVIFFMVTATFAASRGLGLDLPAERGPIDESGTREAVHLHVFADHAQLDCSPVEAGGVERRLRSILSIHPQTPVVLVVEPEATYERMVLFYDELSRLQGEGILSEIHLPTRRDRENYTKIFGEDPFDAACRF